MSSLPVRNALAGEDHFKTQLQALLADHVTVLRLACLNLKADPEAIQPIDAVRRASPRIGARWFSPRPGFARSRAMANCL